MSESISLEDYKYLFFKGVKKIKSEMHLHLIEWKKSYPPYNLMENNYYELYNTIIIQKDL